MSKKQGLHGIRAFLVVVGSGIVAGLLVVLIISNVIKAFVSVSSESFGDPVLGSASSVPTRGPVTSLEPGSFDLCQSVENIQAFNSVYQERLDDGSGFVDTALDDPEASVREISNECSWVIIVGGMVEAEVSLSYESIIGGDVFSVEEAVRGVEHLVEDVSGEGELGGLPEGGYYLYGQSGKDEIFVFVGIVKNTSFSMVFRNKKDSEISLEADYRTLVRQMIPDIRERLDRIIPD